MRRVLTAAIELTGAQYGALGVLGGDGLSQFLYEGMSPEQAAEVGSLPRGRGARRTHHSSGPAAVEPTVRTPVSHRIPGWAPADGVVPGVPLRSGDSVFGNLYLTEKAGGFDESDEARVLALAAAAGVAIRNAQLFETARLGAQWQAAAAEMANAALRGKTAERCWNFWRDMPAASPTPTSPSW